MIEIGQKSKARPFFKNTKREEKEDRRHCERPPALVYFGGRARSPGIAQTNATLTDRAGAGQSVFFVGNLRLLRRFAPRNDIIRLFLERPALCHPSSIGRLTISNMQ
jgi:hypothetical protein